MSYENKITNVNALINYFSKFFRYSVYDNQNRNYPSLPYYGGSLPNINMQSQTNTRTRFTEYENMMTQQIIGRQNTDDVFQQPGGSIAPVFPIATSIQRPSCRYSGVQQRRYSADFASSGGGGIGGSRRTSTVTSPRDIPPIDSFTFQNPVHPSMSMQQGRMHGTMHVGHRRFSSSSAEEVSMYGQVAAPVNEPVRFTESTSERSHFAASVSVENRYETIGIGRSGADPAIFVRGSNLPKNFDKQKKKKKRKRVERGGFSIYSALVWSKSIFAIETYLQTIIYIYMTSRGVFSRQNTFGMIVLAL